MSENLVETTGRAADKLDNLLAGMVMPLPPQMHLDCLKESLQDLSKDLKSAYREETGEDPWEDQ
jgi:hypothetical protein